MKQFTRHLIDKKVSLREFRFPGGICFTSHANNAGVKADVGFLNRFSGLHYSRETSEEPGHAGMTREAPMAATENISYKFVCESSLGTDDARRRDVPVRMLR